ncbi:MAG: hypothetical protein C0476_07225 [Sphingomonas sp.]|nr:hypothetical protein [Sphingomonas sp.]
MTALFSADQFAMARATATQPPAAIGHNRRAGHVFDLHPMLHVAVFGSFFVYLGIMWAAFADPGLAIPFVIFMIFLAAFFVVPALWARIAAPVGQVESWEDFRQQGISTASGWLSANDATVQVLTMPAMLILWGLAVAIIRATA